MGPGGRAGRRSGDSPRPTATETAAAPPAPARCRARPPHGPADRRSARRRTRWRRGGDAMAPAMHLEQRRLAGAVGADDGDHLARPRPRARRRTAPGSRRRRRRARAPSSSGSGIGGDPHVDFAHRGRRDHASRDRPAPMKPPPCSTTSRSTTRDERMHDVLDPDDRHAAAADVPDQLDQRRAFVLGQAAGDLVEQQHARLAWRARARARAACGRAA